ncbi:uncharacterized protein Dvar_55260 [Desulfosarcina variabilis str. Montpellier]
MRKNRGLSLAVVMFLVIGLLFTATAMATQKGKQETIQGTLEKGEKGITVIKTDDGQTFTVLGQNMAKMIGKKVKITGTLTKGGGNRSVIVSRFEPIEE